MLTIFGGFTLSVISIGWADGTYNNIINMFTRNQLGHIQIHANGYLDRPSLYKWIEGYEDIGDRVGRLENVDTWTPRLYSAALISVGEKSAGARIIGIDPDRERHATGFSNKVTEGRPFSSTAAHEVIIGKGLARTLRASVGDELVIFTQAADGSLANDLYAIVGIVESGNSMADQSALYLPLTAAQDLLVLEDRVHELAVIVGDLGAVKDVEASIEDALAGRTLDVERWQEFARSFYVAMQADKQGSWIMLFIILLIVAIGVLNTVLMTVLERRREYGVLRALGTRPSQVLRLVLLEVASMAVVSIIIGCFVGVGVNYLLSLKGVPMPQQFTYGGMEFSRFYTEVNAHSLYVPAVTVFVTSVIVGLFPAIKASRVAPAQALRTQ
jgi:ABC-type lipoprotein release transport system permease subunit